MIHLERVAHLAPFVVLTLVIDALDHITECLELGDDKVCCECPSDQHYVVLDAAAKDIKTRHLVNQCISFTSYQIKESQNVLSKL